jgi:DNA-binding transcriptional MerR regulator
MVMNLPPPVILRRLSPLRKEELYELIDKILPDQPVLLADIPDIDLYVDQVTSFIEKKLAQQKRHPKDKLLTKTMINNYAKAGILIPPRKKKYSRQHIEILLMVYSAKQILSINDISLLFSILQKPGDKHDEIEEDGSNSLIDLVYSLVQEINNGQAEQLQEVCEEKIELIKEKTKNVNDETRELAEWFLLAMCLVSQAAVQKRMAEAIIDQYFKKDAPPKGKPN